MKNDFITENDKIYDIVKKYPAILDTLLSISPDFKKLKNPILFNSVAKLTTIKTAAKMGKVYLNEMLYQLNATIGKEKEFLEWQKKNIFKGKDKFIKEHFTDAKPAPDWATDAEKYKVLDVRFDKEDPFIKITSLTKTLVNDDGFTLIQKFEPFPLILFLEKQGFEHFTKKVADEKFVIYFRKTK